MLDDNHHPQQQDNRVPVDQFIRLCRVMTRAATISTAPSKTPAGRPSLIKCSLRPQIIRYVNAKIKIAVIIYRLSSLV